MIDLEILNTGAGHLRITFDPGEPGEVEKAKDTISLLLRRGFALFVHEGGQTIRVRDFDPERGSYYVDAIPDAAQQTKAESDASPGGIIPCRCGKPLGHRGACKGVKRGPRGRRGRMIPAAGHRVTAVGRTAGG